MKKTKEVLVTETEMVFLESIDNVPAIKARMPILQLARPMRAVIEDWIFRGKILELGISQ